MLLDLKPNVKLLKEADFFDIYDHTGFLFGYNVGPIHHQLAQFKKIKPELIGTELSIVFSKKKQLTPEENAIVIKRMFRTPREEIFSLKVRIPELTQYSTDSVCSIYLDQVGEPTNKYVSPCGHLFHLNCIFDYLEAKNRLHPIHPRCTKFCCGAKKAKPFECPVCKTLITR